MPDALQYFRVEKLKEFGCNAIRTSHNPPTPELLDACDRLGMLVMDESRLLGSDSENMSKWDDQIRRDRNHPSVAIWSIANEEFAVQDTPQAAQRRAHDAGLRQAARPDAARHLRLAGRRRIPRHQFRHRSARLELSLGHGHGQLSRRTSQPAERRHRAGQHRQHARHLHERPGARLRERLRFEVWPGWTTTAESWWSYFADRPWLSGGFVWTGFDYRGEPTPYWLAVHQFAFRHSRHLRFSEGQFLLLPIVVDDEHRAAPAAALELAGQGRPGNPRRTPSATANRWNCF